jgi:hypothetical protein
MEHWQPRPPTHAWVFNTKALSPYFETFMEPRNQFQGMNSASLCSLAGRYDNPIPTRFQAPIDRLKIPALAGRYDNPIPARFLAPIDCLKITAPVPAVTPHVSARDWKISQGKGIYQNINIPYTVEYPKSKRLYSYLLMNSGTFSTPKKNNLR